MALASYPGFFSTTPPTDASPFGVYWPTLVPADVPKHAVLLEDGSRIAIPPTESIRLSDSINIIAPTALDVAKGPTRQAPLGTIFGIDRVTKEETRTSASRRAMRGPMPGSKPF